jgi:hypothetical protein
MGTRALKAGALGLLLTLAVVAVATAVVVQAEGVRITVLSQIMPVKLPRSEPAPIAVFVAGHLATPGGSIPPQLQRLDIEVNRHGLLRSRGLPVCHPHQVQATTTERALANCGEALVGSGQFWAHIILPGQEPYPTKGRLLIFNGRRQGQPVLLTQIYTSNPFDSAFLIEFSIRHISRGPYGTELSAAFPEALGEWGYVDRIKLTLKRRYSYRSRELSYFNAACPAPKPAKRASFPLAHITFSFAETQEIGATVNKTCGVEQ